jgi:hypothetical protein
MSNFFERDNLSYIFYVIFLIIFLVKSVAGSGLIVVSSSAKSICQEINEDEKKELMSKRDDW